MAEVFVDETSAAVSSRLPWRKIKTQQWGEAEIEVWDSIPEIGRLIYRKGDLQLTLESSSWMNGLFGRPRRWVSIPPALHEKYPWLAEDLHRALLSMNIPNTVALQIRP